jgi:hypothetical protein
MNLVKSCFLQAQYIHTMYKENQGKKGKKNWWNKFLLLCNLLWSTDWKWKKIWTRLAEQCCGPWNEYVYKRISWSFWWTNDKSEIVTSHSFDLNHCHFQLCSILNDKVYVNNPRSLWGQKKICGRKLLLFEVNFATCLETFVQDVGSAQKQITHEDYTFNCSRSQCRW